MWWVYVISDSHARWFHVYVRRCGVCFCGILLPRPALFHAVLMIWCGVCTCEMRLVFLLLFMRARWTVKCTLFFIAIILYSLACLPRQRHRREGGDLNSESKLHMPFNEHIIYVMSDLLCNFNEESGGYRSSELISDYFLNWWGRELIASISSSLSLHQICGNVGVTATESLFNKF